MSRPTNAEGATRYVIARGYDVWRSNVVDRALLSHHPRVVGRRLGSTRQIRPDL